MAEGSPVLPAGSSLLWTDIRRAAAAGGEVRVYVDGSLVAATWAASLLADYEAALLADAVKPQLPADHPACGWWDGPSGHVYGVCNLPAGHEGRWHQESGPDGELWASWGGGNPPPAPPTRGAASLPPWMRTVGGR